MSTTFSTTRTLGRSNIQVSAVGMGCWAIGGPFWSGTAPVGWGEVNDEESIRAIHRALDLGVNFFDSADVYGAGHSERVLGRALAGRRDQAVIATKFGNAFDEESKQITGANTTPAYIRQACEASLKRLNTDVIDLYQLHRNEHELEQAVEIRDTLEDLVKEGKIRSYGWSTDFPERARLFAEGPNCSAVQLQLNVLQDNPAVLAVCEEFNLAAVNRGPLAMGMLTGKYTAASTIPADDVRVQGDRYFLNGVPNSKWLANLEAIREILTSNGRTLAQGALAWIWARSPMTVPIPGFKTVAQVEENSGALSFGPLTADQMQEIERLVERDAM